MHKLKQRWVRDGSNLSGWPSFKIWKFKNGMELPRIDYICVYKIDVSANQYKINLPLLITCTDWTDCTECTDRRLWFHPRVARSTVGDRAVPAVAASRVWNSLFRWPSRRCCYCPCSSDSSIVLFLAATTVNAKAQHRPTVCVAIPSSDLLNFVRCPISRSTLRHLNHIRYRLSDWLILTDWLTN